MACPRVVMPFVFLVLAVAPARIAPGQCQPSWLPGASASGPADHVWALARLPNGDLVAGGDFLVADGVVCNHVARWDGTAWHALGAGTNGPVAALAVLPNGNFVVAGTFTTAGGVPAANIAQWTGATWSPLGAGLDASVFALHVAANGDLIAGGAFTTAGVTPAARIARWSAGSWSSIGGGVPFTVSALTQLVNGDLVAGGFGGSVGNVQRWNGAAWSGFSGPGSLPSWLQTVRSLLAMPDGGFLIGGTAWPSSLAGGVALLRWTGSSFAPQSNIETCALTRDPASGFVFAVGGAYSIRRFDGSTWSFVGPARVSSAEAVLVLRNGEPVVAGRVFDPIEPRAVERLTAATAWTTLAGPVPPRVFAITRFGNGDMVVGGRFASLEGVAAANVARWTGQSWVPLGGGIAGDVQALAVAGNGDLIAGGEFQLAGGGPANRIARWNGSTWSSIGAGPGDAVRAVATRSNGDILIATRFGAIERWDGVAWTQLQPPSASSVGGKLVTLPNDDVAVASSIFAIWNGTAFTPLPPLPAWPGTAGSLLCRRNGDLLAGSSFPDNTGSVRRWTGTAWVPFGPPLLAQVFAMAELPNGDLVAGGLIHLGTSSVVGLVRSDGTQWSAIDGGLQQGVTGIAAGDRGDLMASGSFVLAGSSVAAGFARATAPCPATAVATGTGCASVAGPVTLAAVNLPWAGATFTGRATGMAPISLALHVLGTGTTTLPLPFAAPGCSLSVDPLVTALLFPSGGEVLAPLPIPRTTALAGAQVRSQVIGLELDVNLSLVRTTGTNALLLTIGAL